MKFNSFIVILLFTCSGLWAQNEEENSFNSYYTDPYANIVPPTPNASTFNQYGKLQVNTSTGQPNISIPIYTIVEDGVEVPISLNYSATGIKVDDMSSTVGLKWSLNAGGMISRTINDKDDFSMYTSNGWIRDGENDEDLSHYDKWLQDYDDNFDYDSYDSQKNNLIPFLNTRDKWPDDFSYNVLNYSGGFMYRPDGSILKEFKDNLKVSGNTGDWFTIKDLNGNTFTFGNDDDNIETNKVYTYSFVQGEGENFTIEREAEDVSWLLQDISTKNGKIITFEYEDYRYVRERNPVSQRLVTSFFCSSSSPCNSLLNCYGSGNPGLKNDKLHATKIIDTSYNKLVKRIYTDKVNVEFMYTDGSVSGSTVDGWDKRVDKIIITDLVKNNTKEFHLGYDTYPGNNGGDKRLRLVEVKEKGSDGNFKPPYQFVYETGSLPDPESFSKDYKGYYNGARDNNSLLPKSVSTLNRTRPHGSASTVYPGYDLLSDRYFNENYINIGVLTEIHYPTGGKTKFDYEVNAEGENTNEPLLTSEGATVSTSFQEIYDPTAYGFRTFNALYRFDEPVGRINLSHQGPCPNCGGQGNFDATQVYIFEYDGEVDDPYIDLDNRGPAVSNSPIDKQYMSVPEQNGVYLVQLRVDEDYFDGDEELISVYLDWNQIKIDNNEDIVYQENYYGGLRIKEIKDFDESGSVYNHKSFNYLGSVYGDYSDFLSSENYRNIANQDILSERRILLPGAQKKDGYYYSKVETILKNKNKESKIVEEYEGIQGFKRIRGGYLKKRKVFDSNNHLLKVESKKYTNSTYQEMNFMTPTLQNRSLVPQLGCHKPIAGYNSPTPVNRYEYETTGKISDTTLTVKKYSNKLVANITTYQYNQNHLVTKETIDHRYGATLDMNDNISLFINDPNAEKIEIEYEYPEDFPSEPTLTGVPPSSVVTKKVYNNSLYVLGEFWEFHNGNIKSLYRHNQGQSTHTGGPSYVDTGAEKIARYIVNNDGNPIQITKVNGTPTAYIWGYNGQYPIAKIENSSYASIDTDLRDDVIDESNSSSPNEQPLLNALENLRNGLPDAKVTTFTYKPLNGMTSVTDPKGNTQYFEYDEFGRLEWIKDDEEHILKKYEYHYRQ